MLDKPLSQSYQYIAPELRVFHGADSLLGLKRELGRNGCGRAVVVCGRTVGRSEALAALCDALGPTVAGVIPGVREHSPVAAVEEVARALRDLQADAVIAIGGGSAAVTARAAVIALAERKPFSELCTRRLSDGTFFSPRLQAPKLPLFVVATTPSTAFVKAGSAVHDEHGERLALFDPKTRAKAIIVHPEFVRTAPAQLAMGAALNAFANAVEALESPKCDPFAESALRHALYLIRTNLNGLTGDDSVARERLIVAALLCGRGTEQVGTGLASVLAHAIGRRGNAANGIVNAIVLPHTMRYNAPVTRGRSDAIVEALGETAKRRGGLAASAAVEHFLDQLTVPRALREIGVEQDALQKIAGAAMSDWFLTRNARVVPDVATLLEILGAAW